ncbi:UNVERIFIED_CONTAM: hypothetical protein Sindi_0018600 [Sesamum indicum]
MAEESKTSVKYEKPKPIIPNLCMDTLKAPSCSSALTSPVALSKSATVRRYNCLCSPTTHAGSFRCRYHRNVGLTRNSLSVGSNLSELAGKSSVICENVPRVHLMSAQRQGSS